MDTAVIIIFAAIIVAVVLYFTLMRKYVKAGPNEILIISGGKKHAITLPDGSIREIGYRFQLGGGTYIHPYVERAQTLPIEVNTIGIKTPEVLSADGIPILADGAAQVRIDTSDDYHTYLGIENFLGKGNEGIREVALTVLEGKVREVIGSMRVEEIYQNRHLFNDKVQEESSKDLANLGLSMISFSLKDISDTQGYLDALSKPKIAEAKQLASIAEAEAEKEAIIKASEAKKEGDIARLKAEAQVAARQWENETLKAKSQTAVNKQKAQADLAYELERSRLAQELKKEEYQLKHIEAEEETRLQEKLIAKKQNELEANVLKPAEARKAQVLAEADAESYRLAKESEGKAIARQKENEVEIERILKLGEAEAKALLEKAKAFEHFNEAAMYKMVLDILPDLAKNVAEPLSRIEKITLVGGADGSTGASKITGQVSEILAQLPEVIKSLTGVDIARYLKDKLGGEQ